MVRSHSWHQSLRDRLALSLLAAIVGCQEVPTHFEGSDGAIAVDGPTGVVSTDPNQPDRNSLDQEKDARRLGEHVRRILERIRRAGILDEIGKELRDARVLVVPDPPDGPQPPQTVRRVTVKVEIVQNVDALERQVTADLAPEDAAREKERMKRNREAGTYGSGNTYHKPDGTIVIKLIAFDVLMSEENHASLIETILHELAHAELRAYWITGREIDPPVDETGHGGKWQEVFDKLKALFAKNDRKQ